MTSPKYVRTVDLGDLGTFEVPSGIARTNVGLGWIVKTKPNRYISDTKYGGAARSLEVAIDYLASNPRIKTEQADATSPKPTARNFQRYKHYIANCGQPVQVPQGISRTHLGWAATRGGDTLFFTDTRYGTDVRSFDAAKAFISAPEVDTAAYKEPWHPHLSRHHRLSTGKSVKVAKHIKRCKAGWQVVLGGDPTRFFGDAKYGTQELALEAATYHLKERWTTSERADAPALRKPNAATTKSRGKRRPSKSTPPESSKAPRVIVGEGRRLDLPEGVCFSHKGGEKAATFRIAADHLWDFPVSRYRTLERAHEMAVRFLNEELRTGKVRGDSSSLAPWHFYKSRYEIVAGVEWVIPKYMHLIGERRWCVRAPGRPQEMFSAHAYGSLDKAYRAAFRRLYEVFPDFSPRTGYRKRTLKGLTPGTAISLTCVHHSLVSS